MHVRQILDSKAAGVATVAPSATLTDVARLLADHCVGALVVSDDGAQIAGIISERDLARAVAAHGAAALDLPVAEAMTTEVSTCSPSDTVDSLMEVMTHERIRHLPVTVDGRLAGIISIGDVVKYRVAELQAESQALQEYLYSGR
ncbi:MAG: CBS domain-containing protein [Actinobacteria bacterium]|nr:CBS domain-containing protein [Actinomycetota bacterium]